MPSFDTTDDPIAHDNYPLVSSGSDGVRVDSSVVGYAPGDVTDWDGEVDPGHVDAALDQLAKRVDDNENTLSLLTDDHGELTGLEDDDHPQYLTEARGDARYYTESELDGGQLDDRYFREDEHVNQSAGFDDAGKPIVLDAGGQVDASMLNDEDIHHGGLAGLGDDDHTIYLLADGTRDLSGHLQVDVDKEIRFRSASERIWSSTGGSLDLSAESSQRFRINGTEEMRLEANRLTFQNGLSTTALDWSSSGVLRFLVGGGEEMRITANTMTFNNGATDCIIDWTTSGMLQFKAWATLMAKLSPSELDVVNRVRGSMLRADQPATGVANTVTFGNNTIAAAGGGMAYLGKLPPPGNGPPSNTTQAGWLRLYIGTAHCAIPYWT